MPTTPGTLAPATPQQTLEKVSSLITELGDDTPEETSEPVVEEQAAPPEHAPPEPSEPEPAPEETPEGEEAVVHQVKVDGEPVEVTLAELKRNYSSQAHNTQRAQELAAREQKLEPEIRAKVEQELQDERLRYAAGLRELTQALAQLNGEPNWVERRKQVSDADFLKEKADWEARKAELDQLRAHEHQEWQKAQTAQQQQHLAYLQGEETKLRTAIPEWGKDTAKGKAEIQKLASFVKTKYGVPEQQVAVAFQTASAILMARDAYRYAELHREPTVQPRRAPIKAAKPGTPERPRPNAEQERLIEQAARTHRSMDAAKAIEKMLGD